MEEIKAPKKERKFLKAVGNIGKVLAEELVMGIARKFIGKVVDKVKFPKKRETLSLLLLLLAIFFKSSLFSNHNCHKFLLWISFIQNSQLEGLSSSGKSKNIINAAKWCLQNSLKTITFTGHNKNNPLKSLNNKGINFWINSKAYNLVELSHLFILLSIVDLIIGKNIYKA